MEGGKSQARGPRELVTSGCSPVTEARGLPWHTANPFVQMLAASWVMHMPQHYTRVEEGTFRQERRTSVLWRAC